jgi:hypothetical protein
MEGSSGDDRSKRGWGPPPDSDLIGIPLVLGVTLAVIATIAAFIFIGWFGLIVLGVVLVAALAISFRVIMDSESDD